VGAAAKPIREVSMALELGRPSIPEPQRATGKRIDVKAA
jgi:hypothetical protein